MNSQTNIKITPAMIFQSYEIGKQFYNNTISRTEGIDNLTRIGMNQSSASGYIYQYSNLIQGKLYTRTTKAFATDYFLNKIYSENGKGNLQKALLSLSQHIDYYEDKSGVTLKKQREIYFKYLSSIKIVVDNLVFPDEVSKNLKYSEGKTKQVVVNTYERNIIARQLCLEHYGTTCEICNFDFEKTYGELGKGFIHVHHKVELSTIGEEYSVNPLQDLIPVCPNCHAMLHKRKPAYSIEELKTIIGKKLIS